MFGLRRNQCSAWSGIRSRALIGMPVEAAPYPGARPHFLIEGDIDDREWLTALIEVTARELPPPKAKK